MLQLAATSFSINVIILFPALFLIFFLLVILFGNPLAEAATTVFKTNIALLAIISSQQ